MEIEVTVQSILPSEGPQGRYRIKMNPNDNVEQLLRRTCAEAHVPLKPSYCIRHAANKVLPREAILSTCNVRNGEVVHWTDEEHIVRKVGGFNTIWFMCVLSLLIGAIGLITVSVLKSQVPDKEFDYGIVMDAGSSHTSLYIYKWDGAKYKQTAEASQTGETCKAPGKGISSYAANPEGLSDGLRHCLDFAKTTIPGDKWSSSPVYLGATAGMRLLNEVNSSQSSAVLIEVRKTIQEYPFNFTDPDRQARIISGEEEGTFSWITSNYISKSLNDKNPLSSVLNAVKSKTIGALDMGGASAQISFIPANFTSMPANYSNTVRLYGDNYTLYTHSFLCYGVNEAMRRVQAALAAQQNYNLTVKDPCAPKDFVINTTYENVFKAPCTSGRHAVETYGYNIDLPEDITDMNETFHFVGESNATACQAFVEENLFNFTETCNYKQCSFNGQYQPHVFGEFYAFSSFYYVTTFLNLTQDNKQFSLEEFKNTTAEFCSKTWEEIENIPAALPKQRPWYCFQANYIITMLTKGYKFNDENWNTLKFVGQVEKTDIGWALGFMLNESNQIPVSTVVDTFSTTLFVLLVVLFTLFIIVSVGFACHARRNIKTKGRGYSLFSNYGAV
ncbi:hypothetical protein SNE40_007339 [Patella caerulea]|uniref:Ectonucleoside triphosphate diphosphohydrolase 1 n=1 Tax=Patella caerulea TaxID=87958 RepID=A0AAN8PUV0_PATCE